MKYTEQELKNILTGHFVEDGWPAQLTAIIERFMASTHFVTVELPDYGQSYADLFCHKKDQPPDSPSIRVFNNGISVYLSKAVPVAVYGANDYRVTSWTSMTSSSVYEMPFGSWEKEIDEIKIILRDFKVTLLDKQYCVQKIPFDTPSDFYLMKKDMFEIYFHSFD